MESFDLEPRLLVAHPSDPLLRRPAFLVGRTRSQLAGPAVALGLGLMTGPAAPLEVGGCGRPPGVAGLDMIALAAKPLAAVGALRPVEVRGRAELEGDLDRNRDVPGEAPVVAQVDSVVEQSAKKRILARQEPVRYRGCDSVRRPLRRSSPSLPPRG